MLKLRGIMPALLTCYDGNGELTTKDLDKYLGFLLDRGCSGFFVGGATGEGLLQSVDERAKYTEAVVSILAGEVPVIAHVGCLNTQDACDLAQRAEAAGADAVGSVLPVYYRLGPDAIAKYYRSIGEATSLPQLIYYCADTSSQSLDPEVFASKIAGLPTVEAMKYTSADLETFRRIMDLTDHRLSMVSGCDQLLLPALTMGSDGAIGSTYNCMPEIFVGIYEAYHSCNIEKAENLMARGFHIIQTLAHKYPLRAAIREILRIRGYETGQCRKPLPPLTDNQRQGLRQDLETEDFFEPPIIT